MTTKINATKFGIMGAIIGGLKFKLDEMTLRAAEEAEARKEARLAAIREEAAMRGEARANEEWTRRNAIEDKQQTARDDRTLDRTLTLQRDQQRFQSGEKQADRAHDLTLIDARLNADGKLVDIQTGAALTRAQFEERQRRAGLVFDTEYTRRRGPKSGNDPERGKGIVGSDGKTYKYGEPLPPGVKPAGGYGVSWAPSESKSTAPGGRRRGGVGREAMPSAPAAPQIGTMARPQSQEEYAQLPSGTSYVAPDGSIRVKP